MSKKEKTFWAGYVDGKPMVWDFNDGYGAKDARGPAIYDTKAEARKRFEDVRRVKIVEVKKPRP